MICMKFEKSANISQKQTWFGILSIFLLIGPVTGWADPLRGRIIKPEGLYADHNASQGIPVTALISGDFSKPKSFYNLCAKIRELSIDSSIDLVLFDLSASYIGINLTQLSELDRHIQNLKLAGKKTYAWIEDGDSTHYSIASACDSVLMADLGGLDLPSLSMVSMHFRDAMDLLGIQADYTRSGEYKGAIEPFVRSEMSSHLRDHYTAMLRTMNDELVLRIASNRGLNMATIRKVQKKRLFPAEESKSWKLVDHTLPLGTVRSKIAAIENQDIRWILPEKSTPKPVSIFDLMSRLMGQSGKSSTPQDSIAVLHLNGQIMPGNKEIPGIIISGHTVSEIRHLKSDSGVKGVVIRINSPGGAVTASEAIRSALQDLAKVKPVVFSMGSVTASGGYWITCIERPIFAEAGTLTGSIGVFALKLQFGPFLRRLGINFQTVALDESAGALSLHRSWTDDERNEIQSYVNGIYARFTGLVKTSRKLDAEQTESLAGGRVWSGKQAFDAGLIDHLGGLQDAIQLAVRESGLGDDYGVIHRPKEKTLFELFQIFENSEEAVREFIQPTAWKLLNRLGFTGSMARNLIQDSLSPIPQKAWLLTPIECRIR